MEIKLTMSVDEARIILALIKGDTDRYGGSKSSDVDWRGIIERLEEQLAEVLPAGSKI